MPLIPVIQTQSHPPFLHLSVFVFLSVISVSTWVNTSSSSLILSSPSPERSSHPQSPLSSRTSALPHSPLHHHLLLLLILFALVSLHFHPSTPPNTNPAATITAALSGTLGLKYTRCADLNYCCERHKLLSVWTAQGKSSLIFKTKLMFHLFYMCFRLNTGG